MGHTHAVETRKVEHFSYKLPRPTILLEDRSREFGLEENREIKTFILMSRHQNAVQNQNSQHIFQKYDKYRIIWKR
jgi:hypothetical protein